MPVPSVRSLRSLQGRYDMIKSCCSRWSGCLEQVRTAPPSGCTTDDYDRIAMERYKRMPASKNRPFVLQHCWKYLEHSEKWRLRYQEASPNKGAFIELDDDTDALKGKISKGKLYIQVPLVESHVACHQLQLPVTPLPCPPPDADVIGAPPNPAVAAASRKRQGNHIVQVAVKDGTTSSGFPLVPCRGRPKAVGNGPKRVKKVASRGPAPSPPPMPAVEPTASYNDDGATNVFEETPESWDLHSVPPLCVDFLDKNAANIDTAPLGAFDAGAEEGDEDGEEENGVDEIEEGVFDGSQPRHRRSSNYTEIEDITLVKAWECVSLDAVADNDQTGKRYWQRIEDKFYHLMPIPSTRSLRSLQGRYDMIKSCCSRWSACLEQVRNAPPSGCTIDDYDRIAMKTYKRMPASKNKPFVFQHCWKLLEHSEKWRLRYQEASPNKGALVELEDDSDALKGESSKGKLDGRKKENAKKQDEATSLREKIDDLVKSKETPVAKQFEAKMGMDKKKQEDKMARWQELREFEERKIAIEERRVLLEEKKLMADILAEENKVMMMDPRGMDPMSREWWEIRRGEILQRRRQASGGGAGASACGGDGADKLGDDGVA